MQQDSEAINQWKRDMEQYETKKKGSAIESNPALQNSRTQGSQKANYNPITHQYVDEEQESAVKNFESEQQLLEKRQYDNSRKNQPNYNIINNSNSLSNGASNYNKQQSYQNPEPAYERSYEMPLSGPSVKSQNQTPLTIPKNLVDHVPVRSIKPANRDYDILSHQLNGMKVSDAPTSGYNKLDSTPNKSEKLYNFDRITPNQQTLQPRDYNIINNQYFEGSDKQSRDMDQRKEAAKNTFNIITGEYSNKNASELYKNQLLQHASHKFKDTGKQQSLPSGYGAVVSRTEESGQIEGYGSEGPTGGYDYENQKLYDQLMEEYYQNNGGDIPSSYGGGYKNQSESVAQKTWDQVKPNLYQEFQNIPQPPTNFIPKKNTQPLNQQATKVVAAPIRGNSKRK